MKTITGRTTIAGLMAVWGLASPFPAAAAQEGPPTIGIEYVAHACFVIESSTGTRIVKPA